MDILNNLMYNFITFSRIQEFGKGFDIIKYNKMVHQYFVKKKHQ